MTPNGSGSTISPEHLHFNRDFLVTQRSDSISAHFRHWAGHFSVIQTYYFFKILGLGILNFSRDTEKCILNVVPFSYTGLITSIFFMLIHCGAITVIRHGAVHRWPGPSVNVLHCQGEALVFLNFLNHSGRLKSLYDILFFSCRACYSPYQLFRKNINLSDECIMQYSWPVSEIGGLK